MGYPLKFVGFAVALERYLNFKLCAISPHLVQSHPGK
jgi:hypothetical protein